MKEKGIISAGANLLWRRQRVLWWLFGMNLLVGLLATAPVRRQLRILDSSQAASDSLYHQLNFFRFTEAISRPEGLPGAFYNGSTLLMFVYVAFLVFAMGGVLEALAFDRPLRFGEFLRASAEYFWRMVRLLIVFAILVAPLVLAQSFAGDLMDWVEARSDMERLGFFLAVGITIVMGLIGLAVRVWVDVSQVDAVEQDQVAVRRSARRAWRLLRGGFWRLYGAVIGIQVLLFVISALLFALWVKLPAEAIGGTFVIGEVMVLLWLTFRLWQKAVEVVWYEGRAAAEVVVASALEARIATDPAAT